MRFIAVFSISFYTLISFLIGGFFIAFALGWLKMQDISAILGYIHSSLNSRIVTGMTGSLLIVINTLLAQLMLGRMEKEKTIAFNTTTGQVTIALSAVEDLIKRITLSFPAIKELRPNVIANKRGVEVNLRVVLYSEVNIPDLTNNVQEAIKTKIQEMLGIEEQITVKVHIAKIIAEEKKKTSASTTEEKMVSPYSAYERT